ncbi:MAG: hypothetical protein ACTTKH_07030 [Treponema sp.]
MSIIHIIRISSFLEKLAKKAKKIEKKVFIMVVVNAINNESFPPIKVRAKRSLPKLSVPKIWEQDGGASICVKSISIGSFLYIIWKKKEEYYK